MEVIHLQDLEDAFTSIPNGEAAKDAALDQLGICEDCMIGFTQGATRDLVEDTPEMPLWIWSMHFLLIGIAAGRKAELDNNKNTDDPPTT